MRCDRTQPTRTSRPRRAFSLVEVVVVIAILALLSGLVVAAVQRVRESAAKASCSNNLRQIALAAHQYHDQFKALPPGTRSPAGPDPMPFVSWQAQILPFLDQPDLWHLTVAAFRSEPDFLRNPPHAGLSTPLRIYGCPSDPRAATAPVLADGIARALTSYQGSEGTRASRQDGVLFLDSKIRLADISDGASSTLLAGERPPSPDFLFGWWYAGWGQDRDGEGDAVLGVRTLNRQDKYPSCPVGPYHFQQGDLKNLCDTFHFWSPHPGGAHFLFADGSVHFLRYSADPILPALATRAGGEAVALD
jgi:prepilin-type N-terminal cleavage/methylation domain-containing protein/prepilin-type processing-associated H-X9-DG protein